MKIHGPPLLAALEEGKLDTNTYHNTCLMDKRAVKHQCQLARGDKGVRFTKWFKSAVVAIKKYHFRRSMEEQCILVSK